VATFRLHGSAGGWEGVWKALERLTDPDALLEAAVARLRATTPNVERHGFHLVIHEDDVEDVAARTRELVRVVSAEPYLIEGKYTFLPYFHERAYLNALRWHGSLASSRLEQFSDPASFDGQVEVRCDSISMYLEPMTKDPDVVILLGGVPLERPVRVTTPQLLFLTRRSNPTAEERIILFANQPDVVFFASHLLLSPLPEAGTREPWTLTALEAARLRGGPFSLMLIDRAAGQRRDTVATLASNVRRTVGYLDDILAIAAEGDEDDLIVHGDQMREHFVSPDVRIADALARADETPQALYARVTAMLGR
jgi:hypothetical protein